MLILWKVRCNRCNIREAERKTENCTIILRGKKYEWLCQTNERSASWIHLSSECYKSLAMVVEYLQLLFINLGSFFFSFKQQFKIKFYRWRTSRHSVCFFCLPVTPQDDESLTRLVPLPILNFVLFSFLIALLFFRRHAASLIPQLSPKGRETDL